MWTAGRLAERVGARCIGDADAVVSDVKRIDIAGPTDVAFVGEDRGMRLAVGATPGVLLCDEAFFARAADRFDATFLVADDPAWAFKQIVDVLYPPVAAAAAVHASASIDASARVDDSATVGPFAVISAGTEIHRGVAVAAHAVVDNGAVVGEDTQVRARAYIGPGCVVGARCDIGVGAIIGSPGFVFAQDGQGAARRVQHIGRVVISDDVHIGAGTCIDRGTVSDTRVGKGATVDNLVQIGHGVTIGPRAVVIAQAGIGGDCDIGDGAVLCGQAGIQHHVRIGANARVTGQAGVTHDVGAGCAVSGLPAQPHRQWLEQNARLRRHRGLALAPHTLERPISIDQTAASGGLVEGKSDD